MANEARETLKRLRAQKNRNFQPSNTQAIVAGAGEEMLANTAGVLNLPTNLINMLSAGANGLASAGDAAGNRIDQMLPQMLQSGPQRTAPIPRIPQINLPSGREMAAGIESPIQAVMAGQSLSDAFQGRMQARTGMQESQPGAFGIGQTLGLAGTLMSGRPHIASMMRPGPQQSGRFSLDEMGDRVDAAGMVQAGATSKEIEAAKRRVESMTLLRDGGGLFDRAVQEGMTRLSHAASPKGLQDRGTRALLAKAADSEGLRSLARGLGRSVESGAEGLLVGMLRDQDPLEIAAFGAGSQLAGSLGNTVADKMVGGPGNRSLWRALGTVGAGTVALQLFLSGTPGGQDAIIQSLETNFDKVAIGTLLGFSVGLGSRRGSASTGTLGGHYPMLADAMASIPRAGVIKIARSAAADPELAQAMNNVQGLGEADAKHYMDILETDDPAQGLRDWMQSNQRVRRILSAPDPRLAGVPVKQGE